MGCGNNDNSNNPITPPIGNCDCCKKMDATLFNMAEEKRVAFDMYYSQVAMDVVFKNYDPNTGQFGETTFPNFAKLKAEIGMGSTDNNTKFLHYKSENANDKYIVAENIFGDTALTIGVMGIECIKMKGIAFISGSIEMLGFEATLPSEAFWSFYFDMKTFALDNKWFKSIISDAYGHANVKFNKFGVDDTPQQGVYLRANGNSHGLTSGQFFFGDGETDTLNRAIVNRLLVVFSIALEVED